MKTVSVRRQGAMTRDDDVISLQRKIAAARCFQRCFREKKRRHHQTLIQSIVFVQSRYRMMKALKLAKARRVDAIAVISTSCSKRVLEAKKYRESTVETQFALDDKQSRRSPGAEQECQVGGSSSKMSKRSAKRRIKSFMKKLLKKLMPKCCFSTTAGTGDT